LKNISTKLIWTARTSALEISLVGSSAPVLSSASSTSEMKIPKRRFMIGPAAATSM
jgi:hypothetical protein